MENRTGPYIPPEAEIYPVESAVLCTSAPASGDDAVIDDEWIIG